MDKISYLNKTADFLNTDDFQKINNDPTTRFVTTVKQLYKTCEQTVQYFSMSDSKKLLLMNPKTPLLYCLPKLHKTYCPARPVLSYIGSPASDLSSWLASTLPTLIDFSEPFAIKYSFPLTHKLSKVPLTPTSLLVSFDVSNLFPSIPPDDCIQYLRELLFSNTTLPTNIILDLCSLTECVLKQNFFKHMTKCMFKDQDLLWDQIFLLF